MTLSVDASAIVAIIGREPESWHFAHRMDWETDRLTSAVAVWKATRAVMRVRGEDISEARALVADFLHEAHLRIVSIGADEANLAIDAYQRYGKGVHVAALNMRACFSYGCASKHDSPILFKGQDFVHTDLKDAMLE